ncbi:M28 family metallopeptidase [Stenotrophomonas sp. PD6]|uniref:M28 family metallopeptidase n=1 Tax=Stenotrophomonas sp. PD6 TaxID=3368612 RepID=UPI003BA1A615
MPIDNISHTRRVQGRFTNRLGERLPAAAEAHRPQLRPLAQAIRIGNAHPLVTAALMLSVVGPGRSPLPLPGRARAGGPPGAAVALLPGAVAALPPAPAYAVDPAGDMLERLIPVRPTLPDPATGIEPTAARLSSIGNALLTACVARPRHCPQAILASSVAATATVAGAAVDTAVELLLQSDGAAAAPDPSMTERADQVLHHLPPHDRQALLQILRECGTGPACTAQIRARLLSLPRPVQAAIENVLEPAVVSTAGPAAAGWPPAAQALVPPPPQSWLDAAVSLLESVYDAPQAAYLLDLQEIADATQDAQTDQPRGMRELLANQRRRATIEALFNATGHPVERLDFNITAHDLRGVPRTAWGRNLLLGFAGPGAPAHTLMVVAHGDMTGTDTHSSGVLDNGTGVATLLALTRELQDLELPRGTRVQLLVTDQGERGMMGAKAHVQRCLARRHCPDAVLNLDMLGRGDALAISGSDQRHLFSMDTQRTDQRQPGVVDAHEAHLRRLLEQAATDLGVAQHPRRAWTQISDHLPFQREGIPALGLTRMTASELAAEADLQATYAELLRRHAAVDWGRMDDYLNGRLPHAEHAAMRDRLAEHEAISRRYRRLGDSTYRASVHNGFDQLDQIQTRAAMDTLNVVRHTVHAWLNDPDPALPRS